MFPTQKRHLKCQEISGKESLVVQAGSCFVQGHDFSRVDKANQINGSFAPEGCEAAYIE
jgi:hypothetical protein